ncbi:MAG: ABC transporter ATP-binding protein [Patescibacteria group bacterium]|jgi:putative ABC transport system ATP-binding protein|nr:ABC transporter ATP-binding protein [Patescibacteria group bacterium]
MLKVEKLQKIYNMGNIIVPALSDVFLDVKPGEMICIMGKSGSGKSTLLHMIGLIDTPTSGTVYFKNKDVSKLSEAKRSKIRLAQMGFVFQEYALLPELTALENVYLPASMLGKWSKEYEERAVTLLDSVGLLERMNHRPYQLSGGQQQRVSIARAMVNRPEIIFADEPTANLDSKSGLLVMQSLRWLNKQFGTTIIFVSHDEDDKKYADRVVYLKDGKLSESKKAVHNA